MALKDYEKIDEEDFYGQPFEKNGIVSIWVGMATDENDQEGLDVLQDLCGVGYYDLAYQESNLQDFNFVDLKVLLEEISYSFSFVKEACEEAENKGIKKVRWIIAQYDFEYNPLLVKRPIAEDPIFLGSFKYTKNL